MTIELTQGANSDRRIAISVDLEDERMVLHVPLLVLSGEVIYFP
jgi:hypothetical protein